MRKLIHALGLVFFAWGATVHATDVINQDKKAYSIKVQGEGKLSISNHSVKSGSSLYGLCNYSFCTFEIPGHKVSATKDAKLKIRDGKFTK